MTITRSPDAALAIGDPSALPPVEQKGFPDFVRLTHDLADRDLVFLANTVSVPVKPETFPSMQVSALLSDDELLNFFDSADLLVAPYQRADGLSLALLEALNCGVPVVGYDSPGVGPLLRRHGQHVIEATYDNLRRAVEAWQFGQLSIRQPTAGSVRDWTYAGGQYVELLLDLNTSHVSGYDSRERAGEAAHEGPARRRQLERYCAPTRAGDTLGLG